MMFSSIQRITLRQLSTGSQIQEVVIIGGGLMGAGIAQVSAQTNHKVTLVDLSEKVLTSSEKRIRTSVSRVAKKLFKDDNKASEAFIEDTMGRLSLVSDGGEALASADLVVEAITENLPLKQRLFREWDEVCPEKTILASNTSTLRISDIMKNVKRQDRVGGLHFFNPVPVMKLLEVIRTDSTSDQTFNAMSAWGRAIGKHTVACKDTIGFIVNRLLGPYIQEALAMVERGDATFQDVDAAMKLGAGYPMGPFELLDYTGLDLHKFINENPDHPFRQESKLINSMVEQGKLGVKSGEGFYKYK
ncbi:hydroxyacyl-coenzyme A dehydrogenase, mitochondrial isoform X1 [Eurytemora carolleeae]|uniref:hydroxyacyl-coenzyme A dehydrogenase, mitochondrial isoform X1 n=2 Tax=Eurytemora carolleeae TaxID=1294199 RepID=UPI000C782C41|nr:hydroxyacyl-coenzyme A dehydrogenase, mitochondrial isoform X1 [Eurytemora carolleeae]|eukprot:XP_023346736.1 hydroxyacyl-coenzyme A dehydrogenase, mitochondrial-like isoform X1 [Eurytemora affinis]